MRKFSFFEIEKQHESNILSAFERNNKFEDIKLIVDISKPDTKNKPEEIKQGKRLPPKKEKKKKGKRK